MNGMKKMQMRINRIAHHNGTVIVKDKLKEECQELIDAIEKNDFENIVEETADVTIMLAELVAVMYVEEYVDDVMEKKVTRTEKALGIGKGDK